jgi:hypothetical protein
MREYQRHVGGELERVALFILPSGPSDIEADDSSSDGGDDDGQDGDDAQASSLPSALSVKGKEREMDVMEKLALSQTLEADQHDREKMQSTVTGLKDLPEGWRPGDRYCLLHNTTEVPWTLDKFDAAEPFSCTSLCGATFKDKTQWREHEEWNFPKSLWICSLCADVFPRRSLLTQHQKIIHGRQNIDVLTDCLDLGGFQRDCFFECGFSSNRFQNWIDHVAGHVESILWTYRPLPEPVWFSGEHGLGPRAALKLIRSDHYRESRRSIEESKGSVYQPIPRKTAETEKKDFEWDREGAEATNALNATSTSPREPVKVSELMAPSMIRDSPTQTQRYEDVEANGLRQFRVFADAEKAKRLIERRRAQASRDRTAKLNELREFAKPFKLKTPIPADLIGILAKDPAK